VKTRRTSSQRTHCSWIRSRHTNRPKSRGQSTHRLGQCSTGLVLAAAGLVLAAESAEVLESVQLLSALESAAAEWAVVPVLWVEVESASALAQCLSCSVP